MTTSNVFNATQTKERYVYRIKITETGEYCKNDSNEPCECGTKGWAEVLMRNCEMKYPDKKLLLVREKYNVER